MRALRRTPRTESTCTPWSITVPRCESNIVHAATRRATDRPRQDRRPVTVVTKFRRLPLQLDQARLLELPDDGPVRGIAHRLLEGPRVRAPLHEPCVFGFISSSRNSSFFNTASTSSCSFFVLQGLGPFPFAQSSAICEQRGPISFFSFSVGNAGVEGRRRVLVARELDHVAAHDLAELGKEAFEFRVAVELFRAVFGVLLELLQGRLRVSYVITENTTREVDDGVTARESLSRTPSPRRYTSRYIRTPRNAPGISGSTCPSPARAAWPSPLSNRA